MYALYVDDDETWCCMLYVVLVFDNLHGMH